MKLIIQNGKVAATATDEYNEAGEFITAPADYDPSVDYDVVNGELVISVLLDVLSVDTWQIEADSTAEAVATYTSNDTVTFVVDGVVVPVEPVDSVATLMISADAPGAIPVQVRAQQFIIIAVEATP